MISLALAAFFATAQPGLPAAAPAPERVLAAGHDKNPDGGKKKKDDEEKEEDLHLTC